MSTRFQLDLPKGFRVSPELSPAQVEDMEGVSKSDMKTGYVWYSFSGIEFDQKSVGLSLCFFGNHLNTVSLAITDDKYGTGWSDWTEEKEKQRAKDTAELLCRHGFQNGDYSWGSIWSGYDPKGGSGSVVVTYKNENGA